MTSSNVGSRMMRPEMIQQLAGTEVNSFFGIQTNQLSVPAVFDLYERTRFLYPAKREKLAPVWPIVQRNWERLREAGELLLCCLTVTDESTGAVSCMTKWRSSRFGWQIQHLVSDGSPLATRAVMTGAIANAYTLGRDRAYQNWFRPDNRFPARVFGTLPAAAGEQEAAVHPLRLWTLGRNLHVAACPAEIHPARTVDQDLLELAKRSRGSLWAMIEELHSDPELEATDQIYRLLDLSRYRRIWTASPRGSDRPLMAAVAYRGPLGINFSFLENRCELLIDPNASVAQIEQIAPALLATASSAYENFELPYIPLVATGAADSALTGMGAHWIRDYTQSVWTHAACPSFYRHINQIYERLLSRVKERNHDDCHSCN